MKIRQLEKNQLDRDYADLRLQIKNKCQNMKTLEGTRPENLSEPKFTGYKATVNPKNM